MKRLTRMKLINWHRFSNETIDFGHSVLLSGENGAGKSTILDAIQYVITCSTTNFNKAAHENGKRSLSTYVRCKTGKENNPYERAGDITAHIALEFYDEDQKRPFIIGAVVDSSDINSEKSGWYLIEKQTFSDDLFFEKRIPKNIKTFRSTKNIKWCATKTDARIMIKNRFGRIEDKFFSLIPKALVFKPIDNIKDFVYSYVLDEKEVNIKDLRENVRTYQDLQKMLDSVKARIEKLEKIEQTYDSIENCLRKDRQYDYFIRRGELEQIQAEIRNTENTISKNNAALKKLSEILCEDEISKESKEVLCNNLISELGQDSNYTAIQALEVNLSQVAHTLDKTLEIEKQLFKDIKSSLKQAEELIQYRKTPAPALFNFQEVFKSPKESENIEPYQEAIEQLLEYKKSYENEILKIELKHHTRADQIKEEMEMLSQKIALLKKKKLTYDPAVNRLVNAIKQEFIKLNRSGTPRVLCEMLTITNPEWANAVEGYLNTQRFYILVNPEDFDIALSIYDRLRAKKEVYGVGLVNVKPLEKYDTAPEGSLATVVTSKNRWAKRYVNMMLGKVHMCEHYNDLKKYPVSITRECMKYQNHVASAIKPKIFETPYIGENAYKVQLEQSEKMLADLSKKWEEKQEIIRRLGKLKKALNTASDTDIKYNLTALSDAFQLKKNKKNFEDELDTLKKNPTIIEQQIKIDQLKSAINDLDKKIQASWRKQGSLAEKNEHLEKDLINLGEQETNQRFAVQSLLDKNKGESFLWEKEYPRQLRNKNHIQFIDNFKRTKKGNLTQKEVFEKMLISKMSEFKTAHDFGAAATVEAYPEFSALYNRLKNSELLEYEAQVDKARQAAEFEFREQFLSKLQENIKQAHNEFNELNNALSDISFSQEKYRFLHSSNKKYSKYYDMITDDFNIIQGESIFSGAFQERYREVIDELFERLALENENENQSQALSLFTDYRTYMDYDIKITHSDGDFSYYSKVCEEKSGGETQTPFYVTIAASFRQLYTKSIGKDAVGIVMFDEAFNNMDDERISGVLEFLNRLEELQIIIAAPPDKIQYIGPSMDKTLLVLTDHKNSYVTEFSKEVLDNESI